MLSFHYMTLLAGGGVFFGPFQACIQRFGPFWRWFLVFPRCFGPIVENPSRLRAQGKKKKKARAESGSWS